MTAQRNPDDLIRTFLDEGQTDLPDRAFDAVRRDIHRTRQRFVIGPWREPDVSSIGRFAGAVALVVAVTFAWSNLRPSDGGIGASPAATPAATPSPTPSPSLISGMVGPLEPGRYRFDYGRAPGSTRESNLSIFITIPSTGWTSWDWFAVDKNYEQSAPGAGASLVMWVITNRYVHPCTDHTLLDPPPGSSIDDIVATLTSQPGITAGEPADVTIDGYAGMSVEITVATDIATCPNGFWPWGGQSDTRYVQGNEELDRIYLLDVEGTRVSFFARIPKRTTAADRAELESVIASIDIQP